MSDLIARLRGLDVELAEEVQAALSDTDHAVALERERIVTYLHWHGLITGAIANVIRAGAHNKEAS